MKYLIKLSIVAAASALVLFTSCKKDDSEIPFTIDTSQIGDAISADGGDKIVTISAPGKWSAVTDATWLKMSPVNGTGLTECKLLVDSTLYNTDRSAIIQVISEGQTKQLEIRVTQKGYEKIITIKDGVIEIPNFGEYGTREFDVEVTTNVPFEVTVPGDKPWVLAKPIDIEALLNRGARPRTIKLHFTWENNSRPDNREVEVTFTPTTPVELAKHDKLAVKQGAAELIVPSIKGDSLSILAIQRNLRSREYETSDRLRNWYGVTVWERTDAEVIADPSLLGRVRIVKFSNCFTFEDIPYEIQFLTALEELSIYSNGNKFLRRLSTGEYLSKLTQLKRLQIFAYGLDRIDPSFKSLVNLEQLDLSMNNFDEIPDILTPENFPNLTYLDLGGNIAWTLINLDSPSRPKEDWAGLYKTSPVGTTAANRTTMSKLFTWSKLKALYLSYNYMQGTLPDMLSEGLPTYQAGDRYWYFDYENMVTDTLWKQVPAILIGTPKVLPNVENLALNLNFFKGDIPFWILYHPNLLKWDPYSRIFTQRDYKDESGVMPSFTNFPETPNYYFEFYPEQEVE